MHDPRRETVVLTRTWVALGVLAGVSLLLARGSHVYAGMALGVALLAWCKGMLVARYFLEVHRAGPIFYAVVMVFAALAPLGLMALAWWGR